MARIDDGHPTFYEFGASSNVFGTLLWEKSVQPPGIQAGGETDITTMRNVVWRTRAPKHLKTLSNSSITVAYDTSAYTALLAMIGVEQEITVCFPDGSTYAFYGWLDEFTPNEMTEDEQPTAACTIIPSNVNPATRQEAPPRYGAPSGASIAKMKQMQAKAEEVESKYTPPQNEKK